MEEPCHGRGFHKSLSHQPGELAANVLAGGPGEIGFHVAECFLDLVALDVHLLHQLPQPVGVGHQVLALTEPRSEFRLAADERTARKKGLVEDGFHQVRQEFLAAAAGGMVDRKLTEPGKLFLQVFALVFQLQQDQPQQPAPAKPGRGHRVVHHFHRHTFALVDDGRVTL